LYRWPLEELAALANARRDLAKAKSYGGRGREIVTYIVDRNINYTNVCNVYCKFCAFYRTERDEDHYVLSFEQLDQKLDELYCCRRSANPDAGRASSEIAVPMVHRSFAAHPRKISAHQYSWVQSAGVQHFAETFRMPLREVISAI
jgi:cyclic dehypoxanthinyl futalosine synthase